MESNDKEDPLTKSLLPDGRPPWRSVGVSGLLQVLFLAVIVILTAAVADKVDIQSRYFHLTYVKTALENWKPNPPKLALHRVIQPDPTPETTVELAARKTLEVDLKPPRITSQSKAHEVAAPQLAPAPAPPPALELSSSTPQPKKPPEAVQLGGFDDLSPAQHSGQNGSGGRGTVVASGFGEVGTWNGTRTRRRGVSSAGVFEQAPAISQQPQSQADPETPRLEPLEIKFKPVPTYTPEARAKKVEGDVIVAVIFTATGQVVVKEVVRGLGYGLDQIALEAVRQIKFIPARKNGISIDTEAKVHITFLLAS